MIVTVQIKEKIYHSLVLFLVERKDVTIELETSDPLYVLIITF